MPRSPLEMYVPHQPWPKQRAWLDLDCLEAFYGGAAAGGKSEALLMAALQYVHVPGYSALILRRDTQRLTLAGGLIPRSFSWLADKGPTWNGTRKTWSFPTAGEPATLSFGYLRDASDKYRYGSSEYQYIAFDELTEFHEDDYLFLFSRLRRRSSLPVPLRMRSASNPGNVGHAWVKQRFIGEQTSFVGEEPVVWRNGIAYVPARIADNPAVQEAEYVRSLSHLPVVDRERLMHGDWTIRAEGLIRLEWLRYYEEHEQQLRLFTPAGVPWTNLAPDQCRRFVTIDPAGTSAERAQEQRGRSPSWTVAAVWNQPFGNHSEHLVLRDVRRQRVGFEGLCHLLRDIYRTWRPSRMYIEREKLGQAAVDVLANELPLETISPSGQDKVERAAPLLVKLERGEIWLPREAPWLAAYQSELLAWSGHPHETADQIDASSYAAQVANSIGRTLCVERVFLH